jgi:NAD(P)H-flavin reductase
VWPLDDAAGRDVLLIAGGIGIAPLRSALLAMIAERKRYGRIVLVYGARTPADLLFCRELERWRQRSDLDTVLTVDRPDESWLGNVGVVTGLVRRAPIDPADTVAMLCGPEVMMRYAADELLRRGVDRAAIHLALERNMKCAVGFCGHCLLGPAFVCKDGPVFAFERIEPWLRIPQM